MPTVQASTKLSLISLHVGGVWNNFYLLMVAFFILLLFFLPSKRVLSPQKSPKFLQFGWNYALRKLSDFVSVGCWFWNLSTLVARNEKSINNAKLKNLNKKLFNPITVEQFLEKIEDIRQNPAKYWFLFDHDIWAPPIPELAHVV